MHKQQTDITLLVQGITCSGCATDLENILRDTDGIVTATVSYAKGKVSILFEQDEISEERLLEKLRKLGLVVKKV